MDSITKLHQHLSRLMGAAPYEKYHITAILQRRKERSPPELLLLFKEHPEPEESSGRKVIWCITHSNYYLNPSERSSFYKLSAHVGSKADQKLQRKIKYKIEKRIGTFDREGRAMLDEHISAVIVRLEEERFLVRNEMAEFGSGGDWWVREAGAEDVFDAGGLGSECMWILIFKGYEVPYFDAEDLVESEGVEEQN